MWSHGRGERWIFFSLTIILAAFFMVWLAHPAAGLTLIGLEMGEQAKFLPQVQSGEIVVSRSFFYFPPIGVGLMLVLVASRWPVRRWYTRATHLVAIAVSLLALPAVEAFGSDQSEWLWRIIMIGAVILLVILSPWLRRLDSRTILVLIAVAALAGAALPTAAFVAVRSAFGEIMRQSPGVGPGVVANLAGNLVLVGIALARIRTSNRTEPS